MKRKDVYLILHNIRSLHNVGSVFRTADAAGAKKIYLTGYTPTPLDRFGKTRPAIHKTALGAEKFVKWEHCKNISTLLKKLKKEKIRLIAVEQNRKAVNYKNLKINYPLALIFGNEVRGLSKQILKKCDKIIEIPMQGKKESLNVSVATGIVLFSLK
jgi:23S rRNA (guanosine2251-2'-O)-methyltransferase